MQYRQWFNICLRATAVSIVWSVLTLAIAVEQFAADDSAKKDSLMDDLSLDAALLASKRDLVQRASSERLKRLRALGNDRTALIAGWEIVQRSREHDADATYQEPSVLELSRFVGLLDGRLRVKVPEWWADTLLNPWIPNRKRGLCFKTPKSASLPRIRTSRNDEFNFIQDISDVRRSPQGLEMTVNYRGESIAIAIPKDKNQGGDPVSLLSAVSDGQNVFVTLSSTWGTPFSLIRIDTESRKVIWSKNVRAAGPNGMSVEGQALVHYVELIAENSRIYIFGRCDFGLYCEAFEVADGECVFRFCTNDIELPGSGAER